MSVEIIVYPKLDLRWVRYHGSARIADLKWVTSRVYSQTNDRPASKSFLDLRDVTEVEVGFQDLMSTSNSAGRRMGAEHRTLRLACHAENDLAYGMGHVYVSLLSNVENVEALLTRDRAEALGFLELDGLPPEDEGIFLT